MCCKILQFVIDILFTVDYDSAGYSITIGANKTEGLRTVNITMDGISGEGDKTFTNRIESVSTTGVILGKRESVVTIMDSTGKFFNNTL